MELLETARAIAEVGRGATVQFGMYCQKFFSVNTSNNDGPDEGDVHGDLRDSYRLGEPEDLLYDQRI